MSVRAGEASSMSAREAWKQRVAAHHEQSSKIRSALGVSGQDRWEPFSSFFKADPHRTDDMEVNRLAQEVTSATTLLDVGAGAGRFALPLALRCKHVTAVEPSPSMGKALRQLAAEAGIENVTLVARPWHEAEVEPADVVLSAHVIYSIEDIGAFVLKLAAHARQRVLMPTFMRPPRARYAPFWRWVYGEDRQELPGAAELMQVLWELGIYPNLEMYPPIPFRPFKDWQRALDALRPRLFITPDTEQDARLQHAMRDLLVETPEGYVIKGLPAGLLALISWQPDARPSPQP
jgi:2-polyprenyl-3-methyl-5-hydroxy-6-metoxy-1,4-benzoquinol methylase